jgi:signal peptidase I
VSDSEAPTESGAPLPESETTRYGAARRALESLTKLPGLLILSLVLAILIKSFLVQAFVIPSASMEPTLMIGDRVLVNRVATHFHPPVRQQVIVFSDPNAPPESRSLIPAFVHWLGNGLGFASTEDFIKRVIGLPGETVQIRNHQVYIDGKPLSEPYLTKQARQGMTNYPRTKVLPGHLFVMGDNRGNSDDSRGSLGQIPISDVIGHAFVKIWPPSRIGWLR